METTMHHPVWMAFHMDHLDPEDRRAVRRWSARIAVVCSSSALLLFAAMAIGTGTPDPQAGATERAGRYDRIIASETRMPNEQAMNEGVRR
jgi:hypothetical protein